MADFHQEGIITTIHSLYDSFDRKEYLVNLERKLEEYSHHRRITLLLPRSHGAALNDAFVDMMLHTYYENAHRFIKSYSDDAEANDLVYDRYQEELTVRHFRAFLWTAWEQSKGPHEAKLIPSWNRVCYSLPEISGHLMKAVVSDNQ